MEECLIIKNNVWYRSNHFSVNRKRLLPGRHAGNNLEVTRSRPGVLLPTERLCLRFFSETIGYNIEGLVQNSELPFQITAEEYPHLGRVSKVRWTDGSWSSQSNRNGLPMFLGRDANKRITKDLVCSMLWACAQSG